MRRIPADLTGNDDGLPGPVNSAFDLDQRNVVYVPRSAGGFAAADTQEEATTAAAGSEPPTPPAPTSSNARPRPALGGPGADDALSGSGTRRRVENTKKVRDQLSWRPGGCRHDTLANTRTSDPTVTAGLYGGSARLSPAIANTLAGRQKLHSTRHITATLRPGLRHTQSGPVRANFSVAPRHQSRQRGGPAVCILHQALLMMDDM